MSDQKQDTTKKGLQPDELALPSLQDHAEDVSQPEAMGWVVRFHVNEIVHGMTPKRLIEWSKENGLDVGKLYGRMKISEYTGKKAAVGDLVHWLCDELYLEHMTVKEMFNKWPLAFPDELVVKDGVPRWTSSS